MCDIELGKYYLMLSDEWIISENPYIIRIDEIVSDGIHYTFPIPSSGLFYMSFTTFTGSFRKLSKAEVLIYV